MSCDNYVLNKISENYSLQNTDIGDIKEELKKKNSCVLALVFGVSITYLWLSRLDVELLLIINEKIVKAEKRFLMTLTI